MDPYLNRVSMIARLVKEPIICFDSTHESLALLTVQTGSTPSTVPSQHQIIVDDPLRVEYVQSFLSVEDLIFVDGYLHAPSDDKSPSWVMVSKAHGSIWRVGQ